MKRFFTGLIVITIVMLLLAFAVKWFSVDLFAKLNVIALPLAVLYFAAVSGIQYWFTLNSMKRSPKQFVQFFLGTTVAVLVLHIIVLVCGMLSNPLGGKSFAVGFLILYVVYTVYIIAAIVQFVRKVQNQNE